MKTVLLAKQIYTGGEKFGLILWAFYFKEKNLSTIQMIQWRFQCDEDCFVSHQYDGFIISHQFRNGIL